MREFISSLMNISNEEYSKRTEALWYNTIVDNTVSFRFYRNINADSNIEFNSSNATCSFNLTKRGTNRNLKQILFSSIFGINEADFNAFEDNKGIPRRINRGFILGNKTPLFLRFSEFNLYDITNRKLLISLRLPITNNNTIIRRHKYQNIHVWVNKDVYDFKHPTYKLLLKHIRAAKKFAFENPTVGRFFVIKDNETMQKTIINSSIEFNSLNMLKSFEEGLLRDSLEISRSVNNNMSTEDIDNITYLINDFKEGWINLV